MLLTALYVYMTYGLSRRKELNSVYPFAAGFFYVCCGGNNATRWTMSKKCGAKTRAGGSCKREAGWGTDHVRSGKCKLHGGALVTAQKGNKHALKHGIYAKLFDAKDLDQAAQMAGSVDTELAIARLQLRNLVEHMQRQGDTVQLDQVEENTIASDHGEDVERAKLERAKVAKQCGEEYDPDEDDFPVEVESAPLTRKRISRRRDFNFEFARLTKLIESLERTRLSLPHQRALTEQVGETTKKIKQEGLGDAGDTSKLTSVELDNAIFSALEGFTA